MGKDQSDIFCQAQKVLLLDLVMLVSRRWPPVSKAKAKS